LAFIMASIISYDSDYGGAHLGLHPFLITTCSLNISYYVLLIVLLYPIWLLWASLHFFPVSLSCSLHLS
jgi:hypothetical protein